ncbi:MAG: tetratricopeptide repeat protein [Gallionella sp.]
MSYSSGFALAVFDQRDPCVKGEALTGAFTLWFGDHAALNDLDVSSIIPLRRFMSGWTRSCWTKCTAQTLFDAAGSFDSLRFISEQTYTHREFKTSESEPIEFKEKTHGEDIQYTLFNPDDYEIVIVDIARFIHWCANNVLLVEKLIDCDGESGILAAIYHTPTSDSPTDFDEEGQGINSLLSTLKTISEYLRHAQEHGLCAVYMNQEYTDWEWYKKTTNLDESHLGYYGKRYANENHIRPILSAHPLLPFPPQGLPIHVAELLASSTPEQREQIKMLKPNWIEGDDLRYLFAQEADLLASGRVVWGALIQANNRLFEPAYILGAPGEVLYDPEGRMSPQGLMDVGSSMLRWKGRKSSHPKIQFFADYLASERTRLFGYISDSGIGDYPLKVSSTYFDQLQLPDGMLSLGYFPILISAQNPNAALLLPHPFWSTEFKETWMQASEKKFGVRQEVASLQDTIKKLHREVEQGDYAAILYLATYYEQGKGMAQDLSAAFRLYQQAAELNVPDAMLRIGEMYRDGYGVMQDYEQANIWIKKAVKLDLPHAEAILNQLPSSDYQQALRLLEKTTSAYPPDAETVFRASEALWYLNAEELKILTFKLYKFASDLGHSGAQFQLAFMYQRGFGTPPDLPRAVELYHLSAKQGYSYAQEALAELYEKGEGVLRNELTAQSWRKKYAAQDPTYEWRLCEAGLDYFHGRGGLAQDFVKAREKWRKAAQVGHPESLNNLGTLYYQGLGVEKDLQMAFMCFSKSAAKGYVLGELNLGKIYLDAARGGVDRANARIWFEKAAAQGNEEAAQLLILTESGLTRLWKKWFY